MAAKDGGGPDSTVAKNDKFRLHFRQVLTEDGGGPVAEFCIRDVTSSQSSSPLVSDATMMAVVEDGGGPDTTVAKTADFCIRDVTSSQSSSQLVSDATMIAVVEDGGGLVGGRQVKKTEAEFTELLQKLSKLRSDASEDLIRILESKYGPKFITFYIKGTPECTELLQAWDRAKPGFPRFMELVAALLRHPFGKSKDRLLISGALDKFARLIIKDKLEELYQELTSKDAERQKAVLQLLVVIVRRGPGLAWEVAKRFDFKLKGFLNLSEWKLRRNEDKRKDNRKKNEKTRKEFVEFAMSFLEAGEPRLLREILQQKDMFSRVLRGLGDDGDEVVAHVLRILHDRLLVEESLVPPALRSVLFGSATLEQLVEISGRVDGGDAAELAHCVLLKVCTDPANGLMSDSNRKGNLKRLLDLLKKLKATEVDHHRHLLLAVVKGRPAFGSGYLDEFPHNVDSPYWLPAISLAAEVLSSVRDGLNFEFVNSQSEEPLPFGSPAVQDILKCIAPRPITRSVINKGLLHVNRIVNHATLRFVLAELELLDSLIGALSGQAMERWASLKQDIQKAVQIALPDTQVLLKLLSSLNDYYKSLDLRMKRPADASELYLAARKKLKTSSASEDTDMASNIPADPVPEIQPCSTEKISVQDLESSFYSKLLDVLKIYHRSLPTAPEDFFKYLPSNPLVIPTILQQSLLTLLKEQVMGTCQRDIPIKSLNIFINMFMYSPIREIKNCAQILAHAAMFSSGAFDTNPMEICTWFLFIPGHSRDIIVSKEEIEVFKKLSSVVIHFLCDAVSTTKKYLETYMDKLRGYICKLDASSDVSPNISPLVVCVLEKCLRLLSSESSSYTVPEKSMISLYVSATLKYLLETQVEAGLLSFLIDLLLSERLESSSIFNQSCSNHCEWRPLNCLLSFARSIRSQKQFGSYKADMSCNFVGGSFSDVLLEVQGMLVSGNLCEPYLIATGFSFSMICASPAEILQKFPSIMSISSKLAGVPFSQLELILFLEPSHLVGFFKQWPDVCYAVLEGVVAGVKGTDSITDNFVDCPEYSTMAFSLFLKAAPFHMLFPTLFLIDSPSLDNSRLQNFLLDKLLAMKPEHCISALRHVLFYLFQARMSYIVNLKQLFAEGVSDCSPCTRDLSPAEFEKFCESAYFLAERILKQLLTEGESGCFPCMWALSPAYHVQEVAKVMFSHPLVTTVWKFPLPAASFIEDDILFWQQEKFLHLAEKCIRKIDHLVLRLLKRTYELLVSSPTNVLEVDHANGEITRSFSLLVQKLIATFKGGFTDCMKKRNFSGLIPTLYALSYLSELIHPSILLELVSWLFSQSDILTFPSALSVGLQVTSSAFSSLRLLMSMSIVKRKRWDSLTGTCSGSFDFSLFDKACLLIFEIAPDVELDIRYECILNAVKVVKFHRHMGKTGLCLIMAASRLLSRIPLDFISHCMHKITQTKAELLFLLSEMSSMHLCEFGYRVSDILSKSQPDVKGGNCSLPQDVDELFLLLPTILLHNDASYMKFSGKHREYFENVASFFWKMLAQGLSCWKRFASKNMFEIELLKCSPSSIKELGTLFSSSLLGKVVLLMEHHLRVSGHLVEFKERLILFDSLCPEKSASADFFNLDISNISLHTLEQLLNLANRVVAKIRFCKLLLFSVTKLAEGKTSGHSELSSSRIRFLNVLVSSWQHVVEKLHTNFDNSEQGKDMNKAILRFLEIFIVKNILDSMSEMRDCLSVLHTFPFVDQLAKFSLIHRFEDPETLKMLQSVLRLLPHERKFSCFSTFQLLIAHCTEENDGKNMFETVGPYKLELVKLLKVLIHIMVQEKFDFGSCNEILTKVISSLLSSYGATISEIDVEIYSLINDIEAADQTLSETVAKMDYLWGSSALKVRKEVEQICSSSSHDIKAVKERRRVSFKENLPIDPKLCLRTVHCFPYDRSTSVCASKLVADNFDQRGKAGPRKILVYDPVFILHFSIHGLTMDFIEPLEFASLGLLAVSFMTLSSPDGDIRKLGYEAIVNFKTALKKCRKKKEVRLLNLLLSYLDNGIEEGQRIPSATAVFVAEASFIVLDNTHDHHSPISKALKKSSGANMKGIPLFQEFFFSCTAKFKSERLWMLRLLNSALHVDDDTKIFVRHSIFETILNFYASPLSDVVSKELIFQIVKTSVRLPKMGRYLVEHCGIVPWLSSLVASFHGTLPKDQISDQLAAVVEVATDIISARSTSKCLEEHGFEQLAQLADDLRRILVGGMRFARKQTRITDLILQFLMTTLKISQNRRVYESHYTLSFEKIYELYKAIDACDGGSFCSTTEIGLKTILMSIPPVTIFDTDKPKLSEFVYWAISTAMQSHLTRVAESEALWCSSSNISEEEHEEDLLSKLLRWLAAAVINGRLSKKLSNAPRLELNSLQSLLDFTEMGSEDQMDISCTQILHESIFYIQQLQSTKRELLPCVVSALSLLLFSGSSAVLESELGVDGIASLFQKINCPAEANSAWRWSFYQPWRDHSSEERSEVEELEGIHACQKLLAVISKKLGGQL